MNQQQGQLITFEGGDGCGKSTQLRLTEKWLKEQGKQVLVTHEPGDTALGSEIRRLLLSGEHNPVPECELLLFLADRAQHVREIIRPAMGAGVYVLCDRYSDSTMAYQLAARKLSTIDGIEPMLRFAEIGMDPNLTLWLDLPVHEALQRMRARTSMGEEKSNRLDEEALSFHKAVHKAFASLQKRFPERMVRIDASLSVEKVQDAIQASMLEKGVA